MNTATLAEASPDDESEARKSEFLFHYLTWLCDEFERTGAHKQRAPSEG